MRMTFKDKAPLIVAELLISILTASISIGWFAIGRTFLGGMFGICSLLAAYWAYNIWTD